MSNIVRPSIFSGWKSGIQRVALATAKLAGYDAAKPSLTHEQHTRYNSNPNTISSQVERVSMMWNAEYLGKNEAFAIGYLNIRRNYCTPTGWTPTTGDIGLNKEITEYLKERNKTLGVNCSLKETFEQISSAELACGGDSALVWIRDDAGELHLMQASSDQIGELYTFSAPVTVPIDDLDYFSGMYFDDRGTRQAFKIYERGFNQVYTNPEVYPAGDVIYFQDNLRRSVRGLTCFHGTILSLEKAHRLFQSGMDSANKQAKVAVVARNNIGAPLDPYSYDQRQTDDGGVVYIERNYDGAQTEYQFNGDSFDYMKTESPGQELIEGCKYADAKAAASLGLSYGFLVSMAAEGGAGIRLAIEKDSKQIERLSERNEAPYSRIMWTLLMDAVNRGDFPTSVLKYDFTKGSVNFPTLPSADAYRDDQTDVKMVRAGLDSRINVMAKYRLNMHEVIKQNGEYAMMAAKEVEDRNKELTDSGYKPVIGIASISQDSDNPQQDAQAEVIDGTTNLQVEQVKV